MLHVLARDSLNARYPVRVSAQGTSVCRGSGVVTTAFDVSDRAIIVTGAAGLLGREYGRVLAAAGASVVLADINEDRVAADAGDLQCQPGKAIGVGVDVTDEASVAQLVRKTLAAFGRID